MKGQQVGELVLRSTPHPGNANQNLDEGSPHTCENGRHPKDEMTDVGEDVEETESADRGSCGGQHGRSTKTLNIGQPCDPAIPLLRLYPQVMKTLTQRSTLSAHSLIHNSQGMETPCPLMDEWMENVCVNIWTAIQS